jgi:hypothetical protein
MRRADLAQSWIIGFALVFMVTTIVMAQTQDYLNGSMAAQINGLAVRIDHLETYLTGIVVATGANLIAHLVSIKSQRKGRRDEEA